MAYSNQPRDEGIEIVALHCEGCGRRRTGRKLRAALANCMLMCPQDPATGQGCGREMLHHLTPDPEKCPCHKLKGRLAISPGEVAALFDNQCPQCKSSVDIPDPGRDGTSVRCGCGQPLVWTAFEGGDFHLIEEDA